MSEISIPFLLITVKTKLLNVTVKMYTYKYNAEESVYTSDKLERIAYLLLYMM